MVSIYFIMISIYHTVKKNLGKHTANLFYAIYITPLLFFWKKNLPLTEDVDLSQIINYQNEITKLKNLDNYNEFIDKNKRRLLYQELKKEFGNE